MIAQTKLEAMSEDERIAWLDSLKGDDRVIVSFPIGYRYSIVIASVARRFLEANLSVDARLKFLEVIDKSTDLFSVDALAQLEPMDNEGFEIYREAMKLGAKRGIDVLGRLDVFAAIAALNPSILTALKMPRPQPKNTMRV